MNRDERAEEQARLRRETNNEPPIELRMLVLEERSPVSFATNVLRYGPAG